MRLHAMCGRLFRYFLVGFLLLALDTLIVLVLFTYLSVNPGLAQFVGRLTGAIAGFILHKHFTFQPTKIDSNQLSGGTQVKGYLLLTIGTLFLSPWVLLGMIDIIGIPLLQAKLMTDFAMVAITYISLRWLFSERNEKRKCTPLK